MRFHNRLTRAVTVAASAVALALVPLGTAAAAPAAPAAVQTIASPADGTAAGAVQWYESHLGATGWEGYCEMAVENAWGTTGIWPSAIDHWYGAVDAGKAHPGDANPPQGAFVYWNISQWGHVGIADGNGGFYSSSINGAIGHADSVYYFANYLGWSNPQVPA